MLKKEGERVNIKRIEATLVLFILGFTLFAIPTGVTTHGSERERYPAHVIAQGNMTLTGDPGTFNITVQANFTAVVPTQLAHGNYSALFSGEAKVSNEKIKFRGELTVEGYEFYVSFTVPNIFPEIPLSGEYEHEYEYQYEHEWGTHEEMEPEELEASFTYEPADIIVNDTVTFNATESTGEISSYEWDFGDNNMTTVSTPIINHTYTAADTYLVTLNVTDSGGLWSVESEEIHVRDQGSEPDEPDEHEPEEEYDASGEFEVTIGPISAPLPTEKTWVKIKGLINSFDEKSAFGWLKAHAKLGEWTKVRAFWTPINLPMNGNQGEGDDDHLDIGFTFSFYAAVLVNTSVVEVNYPGSNFYISGLWNVFNISWTHHGEGDFTYTLESVAEDRTGEFNVTNSMTYFTLNITGVELVSGQVVFFLYRSFVIPRGDVNEDYIVDIWDLVHIAKRYGATPGKPEFDFDIDFDDDFNIGLGELTTVAANLGTEY